MNIVKTSSPTSLCLSKAFLNPIQDGLLKAPFLKICHTMMKLGTVIPYLKKIPKLYESRDTRYEFC